METDSSADEEVTRSSPPGVKDRNGDADICRSWTYPSVSSAFDEAVVEVFQWVSRSHPLVGLFPTIPLYEGLGMRQFDGDSEQTTPLERLSVERRLETARILRGEFVEVITMIRDAAVQMTEEGARLATKRIEEAAASGCAGVVKMGREEAEDFESFVEGFKRLPFASARRLSIEDIGSVFAAIVSPEVASIVARSLKGWLADDSKKARLQEILDNKWEETRARTSNRELAD